jgi:surface polysaccharide O-acyltransferase-like enzyme
MRVVSMCGVVFWHVVSGVLLQGYGTHAWQIANVGTSLVTAAVPLFFMISGAVILHDSRTSSVGFVFKRRLPKIFLPFLAWSLIGIAFFSAIAWYSTRNLRLGAALSWLVHMPITPVMPHLWFMYALILFYALAPALKTLVDNASRNLVLYMLIVWFIFASLLPTIGGLLPADHRSLTSVGVPIQLHSAIGDVGFFVGGYYALKLKKRISAMLLALVVVVDIAAMAVLTALQTRHLGSYYAPAKTYDSVFAVILTFALFFLAKELMQERQLKPNMRRVVGFFAQLSFGVYLCHLIVLTLVQKFFHFTVPMTVTRLFAFYILTLAGSVFAAWVATRLRPLSFVLTGQKYRPWRLLRADVNQVTLRESDKIRLSK